MYKHGLLLVLLSALVSAAWADDSVEAAATGNIVFEKAPELVMQDETLTITKSAGKTIDDDNFKVDVDFHFKNISDHDVTRKIAFVLPPVICRMGDNMMWMGFDADIQNQNLYKGLKDFVTTVDDKTQAYSTRTEATLGNKNITALLTSLNIPLNPCKVQAKADNTFDLKYSDKLKKYSLLTDSNEAAWSENIYFEWTQNFPAGKIIHIHHSYTPVVGGSVLAPRTIEELNNQFTQETPPLTPIWNYDPATLAQSNPEIIYTKSDLNSGNNQKRFCLMPKWVRYNLTTGANWNGGIGIFKLIIKNAPPAPFAVNTFYGNDKKNAVQMTKNENTMTFTIRNLIPQQNLFVLFTSLPKTAEELKACGM